MVHCPDIDAIFHALENPIRRALRKQLAEGHETDGGLAELHGVSLAVSTHLHVLVDEGPIESEQDGPVRLVHLDAAPLGHAFGWLTRYRGL